MKRLSALLPLVVGGLFVQAQHITNVVFSPSTLHECDVLNLTVVGNYPSNNYTLNGYTFDPLTLTLNVFADGTGTSPVTPFSEPIPPLQGFSAGSYTFTAHLFLNSVEVDDWSTPVTILPPQVHDPGSDTFVSICNSGPALSLLSLLDGTPDAGGQWVDPFGNPHSNNFVPGVDPVGVWLYTFYSPIFPASCPTDTLSQLFIDYLPNNNPGDDNTVNICATSSPVNLFTQLLGTPMAGGTWTGPGGVSFTGTYDPAVNGSGLYTYAVPGLSGCPSPTATVTVTETGPSNAGTGGPAEICFNDTAALLNQFLTGTPQQNGTWYDPLGFAMGPWNATFDAVNDFAGTYKYIQAAPGCPADTAFVTVTIVSIPDCFVGISEASAGVRYFGIAPNPSNGIMLLTIDPLKATVFDLEVMNAAGRIVLRSSWAAGGKGPETRVVDLSDQPAGIFVVRLRSAEESIVRRAVVR